MKETESALLNQITGILEQISDGQRVKLPEKEVPCPDSPELEALWNLVQKMGSDYNANYTYVMSLAKGELDIEAPKRNSMANPYKQLQAELLHLTWQIDEISKGDLNQKVSFSGDFSTAINRMIEALREKDRISQLNQQYLQELREVNAMKDKFFSIIAHDLKNPFSGLVGLSDILLTDLENENYGQVREIARLLRDSSSQGYKLLLNLLEWSRIQTGNLKVNIEPVSLRYLLEEVRGIVLEKALRKHIRLDIYLENDVQVLADPNMFQTVVRNLLSNALKFTPERGEVSVSAEIGTDMVEVHVKDTGVGIPADKIDKLYRIDSGFSTRGTNQEAGTGLGLVLCHEFMAQMNGQIRVESTPGKGSCFTVSIPLAV